MSLYRFFYIFIFFVLSVVSIVLFFSSETPEVRVYKGTAMTIDYQVFIGELDENRGVAPFFNQQVDQSSGCEESSPSLCSSTIPYAIPLSYERERVIEKIIAATFEEIDRIYNNWNPDSEVSRFNHLKEGEEMVISEGFENFLWKADKMVTLSEGRFDPTIAPLQKIWKEHLDKGGTPSEKEIENIFPAVGWHKIHFGNGKIVKDDDRTSLDLGGIAKGYCVDLLVERIVEAGFNDVMVEWGGEIRAHGHHPENRAWRVFIGCLDDEDPSKAIGEVNLNCQSIATSGDYIQNWSISKEGKETVYFHIIDPRTGKPLESHSHTIASATVLAPSCLFADALAKAAIMQPSIEAAEQWTQAFKSEYPDTQFWFFSRENSCLESNFLNE